MSSQLQILREHSTPPYLYGIHTDNEANLYIVTDTIVFGDIGGDITVVIKLSPEKQTELKDMFASVAELKPNQSLIINDIMDENVILMAETAEDFIRDFTFDDFEADLYKTGKAFEELVDLDYKWIVGQNSEYFTLQISLITPDINLLVETAFPRSIL